MGPILMSINVCVNVKLDKSYHITGEDMDHSTDNTLLKLSVMYSECSEGFFRTILHRNPEGGQVSTNNHVYWQLSIIILQEY